MITIHCDNNAHRLDAYHLLCILFDKSREITATLSFAIQGDRVNCSGVLQLEDTTLPLQATTLISRHKSQKRAENAAMGKAILEGCNRKLPYGYSVGVRPVKVPLSYIKSGVSPDEITEFLQTDYGMAKRNAEILSALALEELTWEQTLTEKDICFYLSIPFCPTRCSYCSFISSAAPNHLKILPYYVELLCKEIALLGKALQENGYNIRAMYMGGGTPSVLTAKQLEQIFTRLYNYPIFFNIGEITVECGRPDTVDEEKLNILKAFHVDRICINPQTTQDEVLNAIGRCHTTSRFYHAFELARKAGFSTLNCDLIAGLPGDTRAGFEQSITDVLALQPENVTIHTFSAKKSAYLTTTGQTNPTKADTDWVDFARFSCIKNGLQPYYLYRQKNMQASLENIGYAKTGHACMYNIFMMEDMCSIISVGAGGISKLISNCGSTSKIVRVAADKYPFEYLANKEKRVDNMEKISAFLLR